MYKEEILGIVGAIVSYALSYYGFLGQVEFLNLFLSSSLVSSCTRGLLF